MSSLRASMVRLAAGLAAGSGLLAFTRRRRRERGDHRVFILEYHDVSDGEEREGTIAAKDFGRHLRYLKHHVRLVALSEAAALLAGPEPLAEDFAAITFDDGYRGTYEAAWPVLRAEHVPATVFVTTDFLDGRELWFDIARRCLTTAGGTAQPPGLRRELARALGHGPPANSETAIQRLKRLPPVERDAILTGLRALRPDLGPPARALSWAQVREMQAGQIEIGCHTVSHPILSTLTPVEQEGEIVRARDRIAAETGTVPTLFAYPNGAAGDFDASTIEIVRRAGFRAACTTLRGSNRSGCDLLTLRRIGIGADSEAVLGARLAGLFDESVRAYLPGSR